MNARTVQIEQEAQDDVMKVPHVASKLTTNGDVVLCEMLIYLLGS